MDTVIMMVGMVAIVYFLMIRPEQKRRKQAQAMRESLKKGDTVTTIGGVVGRIVQVQPETIIVETSEDRVRMEFTKWAVSQVGLQASEQTASGRTEGEKS